MRRVLIVTNAYAPTMVADMQRARHLAWELPRFGWEVEILVPDGAFQPPSCLDRDSDAFFCARYASAPCKGGFAAPLPIWRSAQCGLARVSSDAARW
jgi:hypothetical protein